MSIELKIKAKHLALEPAIIKVEEKKLIKRISKLGFDEIVKLNSLTWKLGSLHAHRVIAVATEARATNLARAYLKGFAYKRVENNRRTDKEDQFKRNVVPRVLKMINKYGETREQRKLTIEELSEWLSIS